MAHEQLRSELPSVFPGAWSRCPESRCCRSVPNDDGEPGSVERELSAVERERRLGALVSVDLLVAEAVAAASGREVVQRPIEPVASQEPVERGLSSRPVHRIVGRGESSQLGLDERRRIERLLVTLSRSRLVAVPASVAGQQEHSVGEPALVAEPVERLEPGGHGVFPADASPPTISACGRRALS